MQVTAVAYDNPIPGFQTNNTINLRLWAAKPDREFDLQAFNTGDYVQVSCRADCICSDASRSSAYLPYPCPHNMPQENARVCIRHDLTSYVCRPS